MTREQKIDDCVRMVLAGGLRRITGYVSAALDYDGRCREDIVYHTLALWRERYA